MCARIFVMCGAGLLLQLGSMSLLAAEVGSFVSIFSLPSLHNPDEMVVLAPNRANLVYVDFWSAWCAPCREKMPILDELARNHESFEVIGINVDHLVADALLFTIHNPVTYPLALDTNGETARQFGVETLPMGFLIDQQGIVRVINRTATPRELNQLSRYIESLAVSVEAHEEMR